MTLDTELAALHKPLLRFAQMQLRNDSLTEDVVSETLLAIIEKPANFEGRSTLRTYATGILKFKIIDVLRAGVRCTSSRWMTRAWTTPSTRCLPATATGANRQPPGSNPRKRRLCRFAWTGCRRRWAE